MQRNHYEQKAFEDKVYDDAKNESYSPPHVVNVGTDIANGITGAFDKRYIENAEYRDEFNKASDALKKK